MTIGFPAYNSEPPELGGEGHRGAASGSVRRQRDSGETWAIIFLEVSVGRIRQGRTSRFRIS